MTTSATTTAPVAAIERMRVQRPAETEALTRPQLRIIVNGLRQLYPLASIAYDAFGPYLRTTAPVSEDDAVAALVALSDKDRDKAVVEARAQLRAAVHERRLSGQIVNGTLVFAPEQVAARVAEIRVLNIIAEHGTWLTHVNGGSNTEIVNGVDQPYRPIFQAPTPAESQIRPVAVRKGKRLVPFDELTAVEQAAAINLTEMQIDVIAALVATGGEQAARERIEEIIISRERRAAARHTGRGTVAQRALVLAARTLNTTNVVVQPALIGADRTLRSRAVSRRRRPAKPGSTSTAVVLPDGFERKAWHRRDVARALAAIVVTDPDDETLDRYLFTKMQVGVLTYEHVTLVWFFARAGRLEQLDMVNPRSQVFAQMAVEAYDLLEISRRDAGDALRALVSGELSTLEQIENACTKASWLAEADIRRVQRLLPLVAERDSAMPTLRREIGFLAQRVNANPGQFLVDSIAQLNAGQVKRIAAAAGLDVDDDVRNEETEIRQTLKGYGFDSDLDRLVPAGVQAVRAGRGDRFREVMEARAVHDPNWRLMLEDLYDDLSN